MKPLDNIIEENVHSFFLAKFRFIYLQNYQPIKNNTLFRFILSLMEKKFLTVQSQH